MNQRDKRRPNSKTKNVDLFKNYVKPSLSKKSPNVIQLDKSKLLDNDENREIDQGEDGNRPINNYFALPECFRLNFKIKPDQVAEMNPRNIRNNKDKEVKCQFDYTFYKREKYTDKEVDYLKSYLDNYNQHKYREFKKMLEGKSSAKPVGNIFICGDIDVDKEFQRIKQERTIFVENIKESGRKVRLFNETNDNIPNYLNRNHMTQSQILGDTHNDKTPSQRNKNTKQPFRDIGKRKNDTIKPVSKTVENGRVNEISVSDMDKTENVNVIIPQFVTFERFIIPSNNNAGSRNQSEAKSDSKSISDNKNNTQSDKKINRKNCYNNFETNYNNLNLTKETINIYPTHSSNNLNDCNSQPKITQTGMTQLQDRFLNIEIVTQKQINIIAVNNRQNLPLIHSQSSSKNNENVSHFSINESATLADNSSFIKNESNIFADSASSSKYNKQFSDKESVGSSQKIYSNKKDDSKVKTISISIGKISKQGDRKEINEEEAKISKIESNQPTTFVKDNNKKSITKINDNHLSMLSNSNLNNDDNKNINSKDVFFKDFELLRNNKEKLNNSNLIINEINKATQDQLGNIQTENKSLISSKKAEILKHDNCSLLEMKQREEKSIIIKPNNSVHSKSSTVFKENTLLKKEEYNLNILNGKNSKEACNLNNKEFIDKNIQSKAKLEELQSLTKSPTNLIYTQDNPFMFEKNHKTSDKDIQSKSSSSSNLNLLIKTTNSLNNNSNEFGNNIPNITEKSETIKLQTILQNPINQITNNPFVSLNSQVNNLNKSGITFEANKNMKPSFSNLEENTKETLQQFNNNSNQNLTNNNQLNSRISTHNQENKIPLTKIANPFISNTSANDINIPNSNMPSFNQSISQKAHPPNEIAPVPVIESNSERLHNNMIKNDPNLLQINEPSSSFNKNAPPSEMSVSKNDSNRFLMEGNPFLSNPSRVTKPLVNTLNPCVNNDNLNPNSIQNNFNQSNTNFNPFSRNNININIHTNLRNNIITNTHSNVICANNGASDRQFNSGNPFLAGSLNRNDFINTNINLTSPDLQNNNQVQADPQNVSMEVDQSNINHNINNSLNFNKLPFNSIQPSVNLPQSKGILNSFNNNLNKFYSSNNEIKPNPFTPLNNTNCNPNLPINPIQNNPIQQFPQNEQTKPITNLFTLTSSITNTVQNPQINATINNNIQFNTNSFANKEISIKNSAESSFNRFNMNTKSNNITDNRFIKGVNNSNPFLNYTGNNINTNNNNTGNSDSNIFLQAAFSNNNNRAKQSSNQTSSLLQEREPEQRRYLKVVNNR